MPVAHLGRLAVDAGAQGHGLGETLLMDALARVVGAADSIGIHAVEVVTIDEDAKRFYLKYGFTELLDDPHHLYISIKTLRDLIAIERIGIDPQWTRRATVPRNLPEAERGDRADARSLAPLAASPLGESRPIML